MRFVNKNKDQTSASAMKPINVKDGSRWIICLLNINSASSQIRMRNGWTDGGSSCKSSLNNILV